MSEVTEARLCTPQELDEWIAAGKLPEITPTRQERSLRTAVSLIEAGRALLMTLTLEELSVELVCHAAGTTVGAFYGRFVNKHAFFVTMQRVQTIRSEAIVAELAERHAASESTLDALCEEMVAITVRGFRANLGVLRASLQHTREGMWEPFRQSGDRFRVAFTAAMTPHLSHLPAAQRRMRILFAYQVLAGTLVHAVLNDPGPLHLEDDALVPELVRMVKAYLVAPER